MVLGLPSGSLPGDGVEDREELSSDGDEGKLGRLAGLAQALVERAEHRVEARTRLGGVVVRGADGCASAANTPRSTDLPAVAREGRDADQGGDLPPVEVSELRKIGEQRAGNAGSHGGNGLQLAFSAQAASSKRPIRR